MLHKFKEPNTLQALSEWLDFELHILQWGESTHSKVISQTFQRSLSKGATNCVTTESGQDIEVDECRALTTSTSDTTPENSGTVMVTEAAGGDQTHSSRESHASETDYNSQEEDEFQFEGDDGDTCLASYVGYNPPKCTLNCKEKHFLHKCPIFLKLDPKQRSEKIINLKRCLNCLSLNHISKECKSTINCSNCNKRHHSTLCFVKVIKAKNKER